MEETMRSNSLFAPLAFAVAVTVGNLYAQDSGNPSSPRGGERLQERSQMTATGSQGDTALQRPSAKQVIQNWKKTPKEAAEKTIAKYGQPDEVTPQRLVWHNNGPWERTEIVNREIPHDFPKPHMDCLEQTIALQVPPEKLADLAQFDGSVIVDRTPGEISARCDKENMNFLALNLAKDILDGKKSVQEARESYAKAVMAFMQGQQQAYTQGLQFQPARPAVAAFQDKPSPLMQEGMGAADSPGGSDSDEKQQ
jgi:hypothetical protein